MLCYNKTMIIDFENEKNLKVLEFFDEKLGQNNISTFDGQLGENGLPVGVCKVYFDDKGQLASVTCSFDKDNCFSGPTVVRTKQNKIINYYFYSDEYGKIEYTNGASYVGKLLQLKKNGQGVVIDPKGYKLEGEFVDDKKQGEYTMTFLDGVTSKVTYLNDELTGKIVKSIDKYTVLSAYYHKGSVIKAVYENNTDDVKYIMLKPGKNLFYDITGNGQIWIGEEIIYKGDIEDGQKHGKGEEYYSDGSKYVGQFYLDLRDGIGTLYDVNGNIIKSGKWTNDNFVGAKDKTQETKTQNINSLEPKLLKTNSKDMNDVVNIKQAINNIEQNIIGQRKAINAIANNLLLSYLCEKEENKPITSILMTGPTGVGKTETAKQISEHIFGKKPFVVDFANFYGKHMLSSLIGSPSGYIGSDQTPELIKYIDENKAEGGVILFEEIDKADTECLNIFMRILDEGEIISAKNVPYSVRNFIILSTTNMSSHYVNTLGFSSGEKDVRETMVKASTGVKKEQLARFNLVVEYEDLTKEDKMSLCKTAINDAISKLTNITGYNIKFDYNDSIVEKIVNKSNTDFGVREIKKQASRAVSQKLAEFIRNHEEKNLTVKLNSLDDAEIIVNNIETLEETK